MTSLIRVLKDAVLHILSVYNPVQFAGAVTFRVKASTHACKRSITSPTGTKRRSFVGDVEESCLIFQLAALRSESVDHLKASFPSIL